tara:strand:- start:263 stop:697 length:435 start_codon:yes stop_codon:yes gene_type:complete
MPKNKKICYIENNDVVNINNFEKLFILFNEFLCTIKLHYLMTNKYIIHTSINNLYNNLLSLIHKFFEEYIILYKTDMPSTINNITINLSYNNNSNNELIPYIINFRDNIKHYYDNKDDNNIGINIILNDIIFLINKFLYIITLE